MTKIRAGAWRDDSTGPMQVVSGPVGQGARPFRGAEGGPPRRGDAQRSSTGSTAPADIDPVLKAALAHLWFVTIHPFDDGNGRIARAIADMALARSENSPQRFYSMSAQIRQERNYYDILERTQKGTLDITPWMEWFLGCLGRAIDGAQTTLGAVQKHASGSASRTFSERPPAACPQPPARRVRRQAHVLEIREAREVLPGHGPPRHSRSRRARRLVRNPEGGAARAIDLRGYNNPQRTPTQRIGAGTERVRHNRIYYSWSSSSSLSPH